MIKIQTITCASNQSSIDFTSIPGTYSELRLVMSGRSYDSTDAVTININGSASAANLYMSGNGSSAGATYTGYGLIGSLPISTTSSNSFGTMELFFPDYANTALEKTFMGNMVTEDNNGTAYQFLFTGYFGSAAVNRITLNANFVTNSTATLYGINKGSGGATVTTA